MKHTTMVKTYIQKPSQISAIQYTGTNLQDIIDLCEYAYVDNSKLMLQEDNICLPIQCNVDDYVVLAANGRVHTIDKEDFEARYVEDDGRAYASIGSFF